MENAVNYLSPKPFSDEELHGVFAKFENFKSFFMQNNQPNFDGLLKKLGLDEGKKSFLVFKNNKYTTIQTDQIAFFFIRNDSSTIMTFQQEEYAIVQSLDQVQGMLSSKKFFRLNRQYLINFNAIKEVEHYFARKLSVKLVIPSPDQLLIAKEKTRVFLNWLESR
jgi:two-component system response regulator LytT